MAAVVAMVMVLLCGLGDKQAPTSTPFLLTKLPLSLSLVVRLCVYPWGPTVSTAKCPIQQAEPNQS